MNERAAKIAPYWLVFRDLSNSSAAKLVILIPLVGYWIIFNDKLLELSTLNKDIDPLQAGSVSWRLLTTYFGLCFVALGSALYQWLCPAEIKLYSTVSTYVGEVGPLMSNMEQARVEATLENGDTESQRVYSEMVQAFESFRKSERFEEMREALKRNVLQAHFDYCNRRHPLARFAAAVFYGIGFTILLVPSLNIFWRVACVFFKQFFH